MKQELIALLVGIILFMFGIMYLLWTKNFIALRYESFMKVIRRNKKFEVKYRKYNLYMAITSMVGVIPMVVTSIIGFATGEIPEMTFIWVYLGVAVCSLFVSLYPIISKQFIQIVELETELN